MSTPRRAQYDVLRIMRTLTSDGGDGRSETSSRKQGRPTTPQRWHPDVLTSDDILQEKYQELGKLLASQYVERKALSVLETTLLGQKRKKARPASAKKISKNGRRKMQRPTSAKTSLKSDESPWWYDSDNTDYTEMSTTSSAKRVSFADDVVSFSGESSVVITELTDDDKEFEERIKRRPRVSLDEEEMEAREMSYHKDKEDIEHELMRSILRSPRSSWRGGNASPTRSATPTSPRCKSPKRTTKCEKQSTNSMMKHIKNDDDVEDLNENARKEENDDGSGDIDNENAGRNSRNKSTRKDSNKRTITPRDNSKSPRKGKGARPTSPSKNNSKKKRSPRKKKNTEEEQPDTSIESQSPRKETIPIDNQLMNSNNVHIRSWLRKKDAALRKQKRLERKTERDKLEAERIERESRTQRLDESETKYNEWVMNKKRVLKPSKRIARKDLEDVAVQNQDAVAEESRPISPVRVTPRKGRFSAAKQSKKKEVVTPITTHDNSIGIVRDFTGDWSDSVNCKRDLAAERERDEEKRQGREAKKRERQQKAAKAAERAAERKREPKRTFPRASKSPPKSSPPRKNENEENSKINEKQKTRPSNNPLKGMTYDQWLNQKLKSERERKEEIDQEITDPDLEDLIPLLAKHRIQQAKEPSRRVDSGLSRPKSSAAPRKRETSKAFDNNDQNPRPYTWSNSETKLTKEDKWKRFSKNDSFLRVNTPTPPSTPLSNKRSNTGVDSDDILYRVRPEPQGCEIPSHISHCQTEGKNTGDQDSVFMTETSIITRT